MCVHKYVIVMVILVFFMWGISAVHPITPLYDHDTNTEHP
ncbi:hypothetical protein ES703_48845 [subsurface metagenome]